MSIEKHLQKSLKLDACGNTFAKSTKLNFQKRLKLDVLNYMSMDKHLQKVLF
jgi:hypothetical protein